MKTMMYATALAALLAAPALAQQPDLSPAGRPGEILNEADCKAVWEKAGNKELGEGEAKPFVTNFEQVDKDGNKKISQTEFQQGCNVGWVEAQGKTDGTTKTE
jgi:hypothetical protein